MGKYRWLINGKEPEVSCCSNIEQHSWMGYYLLAPANSKETPTPETGPLQETIELRLKRFVGEGLHEEVQLTNHTQIETGVQLELQCEPEFLAREEATGERQQRGTTSKKWREANPGEWELKVDYVAKHHYRHQPEEGEAEFKRGLMLRVRNATSEPRYSNGRLRFLVHLQPHAVWRCCLEWIASVQGRPLPAPSPHHGSTTYDSKQSNYLSNITEFNAGAGDDLRPVVARTARRAALDLCALQMFDLEEGQEVTVAAGVPTYMGVFGRDLMASAWQAALLGPELALGSLRF